jgi:hypothetical protein
MKGMKDTPRKEAPEETGDARRVRKGGNESRHEGGFREGEYGRGPTPYKRGQSHRNGAGMSMDQYEGTSGRGGGGIAGRGDDFKQHASDVEHPQSHADFERLGHEES